MPSGEDPLERLGVKRGDLNQFNRPWICWTTLNKVAPLSLSGIGMAAFLESCDKTFHLKNGGHQSHTVLA